MRVKVNSETTNINSGINQHVLNVITPSGIDYTSTTASLGENIGKLYFISSFPADGVEYGWLSDFCNLEGTSTQIGFHYADPGLMTDAFNKQIKEQKMMQDLAKEESVRQICQKKIDDLEEMIKRISVQREPVGYMNIVLFVQDITLERLNFTRIKNVNSIVSLNGCNMRLLKQRQIQAMQAMAPYGLPEEDVRRKADRNIPISTFTGGFPMADSCIDDDGGDYLGKTYNNRLVFLNMWLRYKDRINSNWVITGVPGIGKSTFLKDLFILQIASGTKVILKDPECEYHDIANHRYINGDIIDCGGGERGRINPLQIRRIPVVKESDLSHGEKMEDYVEFKEEKSALAMHIQWLRTFFKLYFGKEAYTSGVKAALERCLVKTYEKKNITWDTDVRNLKPEDYPYMEDLYETILEEIKDAYAVGKTEYEKTNYEITRDLVEPAAIGADKFLWNGPTTLRSDSRFVVLDTSTLLEADDNIKNSQNYNISGWSWNEMSKDRTQRVLYGEDEGYLSVDPDYPEQMKFLRNVSKRDRKYEAGFMFITHSIVDILDPAVKRLGQGIIDNACYKFIMGCDGKNLEETAKLFNLSSKETTFLSAMNRSAGILFAGSTRQRITIEVAPKILEMMGTAGGR